MRHRSGFTIIEIMIYTAIVGMIMASMIYIIRSMYETRARIRAAILLEDNLRYALFRATSAVRLADGVTSPSSGSSDTLQLDMDDASIDPTIITISNGIILMSQGAGGPMALTSSEVEVTNLTFTVTGSVAPSVEVVLSGELRDAVGPYQTSTTLSNTAVIRR